MSVKWAVIGAGGIADRRTIPALIQDDSNTLVAVMDKSPTLAKTVGEKYNVPYYTDEKVMLDEIDCDAVYISTPVFCHYDQAMLALAHAKHVFIEKPVGLDGTQSKQLLDAFKSAGKQLSVGYMMKYHNLHQKAKQILKDGGIGQVNSVRAQFTCWYPDIPGAWRQNRKLGGGGAIMDLGVHCIELIEYVLDDEIQEVKGIYTTNTFNYEVEDGAIIVFKTKSGTLGHVDVNFNIPDQASNSKFELYGSAGYLICNGTLAQEEVGTLSHLYAPQGDYDASQNRTNPIPVLYESDGGNMYGKQLKQFVELISNGVLDYTHADRAIHVQQIVDKIYQDK